MIGAFCSSSPSEMGVRSSPMRPFFELRNARKLCTVCSSCVFAEFSDAYASCTPMLINLTAVDYVSRIVSYRISQMEVVKLSELTQLSIRSSLCSQNSTMLCTTVLQSSATYVS